MLERENELRRSESVQRRFAKAELSGSTNWIEVAGKVQKEVLDEFGVEPTEAALLAYRCAANNKGISLYVKHNRAREGNLKVGDDAPDVPLVRVGVGGGACAVKLDETSLLALQRSDRPLVVIGGSIS